MIKDWYNDYWNQAPIYGSPESIMKDENGKIIYIFGIPNKELYIRNRINNNNDKKE